jgi:hypothetical protein
MFCGPGLILRRYQGRRVMFSCFALQDSFLAVTRAYGPVFTFCAAELVFGGTEGIRSRLHVLLPQTRFRRYRGRQVQFSRFALPDSFSTVPRASGPVFTYRTPGLVSAVPRVSGPVFMFCVLGLIFSGTEGVGSRFHVMRVWTRSRRYRGRRVPSSCFVLPDSFSAISGASDLVFLFCVPRLIFSGSDSVGSYFRRYQGPRVPFSCLALP